MHKYLFFLGIHPELSTAELKAVFSAESIKYKIENSTKKNLFISVEKKLNVENLMHRLGGTIKIAKLIGENNSPSAIVDFLIDAQPDGKIQFSLTGAQNINPISIKKMIKEKGRSVRYVEIKNTASILHNNLVKKQGDLSVVDNNTYVTLAIQPITELSERDFGRPSADSLSGMIPPKLARMMINLADAPLQSKILDPFCGSGTILTEALAIGYKNIYGSDISQRAIEDVKENIEWYKNTKNLTNIKYKLFLSDVINLTEKIEKNSIQAIISEPFMGRPLHGNENEKSIIRQTEQLAELYINSFKSLHNILRNDGTIIFIIPTFNIRNRWIKIDCVPEIKKIGFEVEPLSEASDSLRYMRVGQHLARDIWKFVKK